MRIPLGFQEAIPRSDDAAVETSSLADRLRVLSRLLAITADEISAMERHDVVRRRECCDARRELQREIDAPWPGTGTADPGDDALDPGDASIAAQLPDRVAGLLAEALEALQQYDREERRMHDRWLALEEDALRAVHGANRITARPAGHYPDRPPLDTRLDVRF